jgi:hypothetical protein
VQSTQIPGIVDARQSQLLERLSQVQLEVLDGLVLLYWLIFSFEASTGKSTISLVAAFANEPSAAVFSLRAGATIGMGTALWLVLFVCWRYTF